MLSKIVEKADVTSDNRIVNNSAHQKPSTCILPITYAARRIIRALMTNENKPSVKIVIGSDRMDRIGFTIRFKSPNTMAKIMVEPKVSKCTPDRILLNKNAEIAVISKRIIKFIVYNLIGSNLIFKNQT